MKLHPWNWNTGFLANLFDDIPIYPYYIKAKRDMQRPELSPEVPALMRQHKLLYSVINSNPIKKV